LGSPDWSGVLADLDGSSTPYDCFTELFTVEVQKKLVDMTDKYVCGFENPTKRTLATILEVRQLVSNHEI